MSGIVKLPAGYRQVEYIESTGTQYVDTGFTPNQDTRVVMDAQPTSVVSNGYHCIFGCRGGGLLFELYKASSSSWGIIFLYGTSYTSGVEIDWATRQKFEINKNVATVGDYSWTHTASTFQLAYNLYLGVDNNAGSPNGFTPIKMYSCQIYDNGTPVRDYVPCITDGGEVGLYDDLNGVFYGNAGTGVFTAGPKVYSEEEITKLEYIESTGTQYVDIGITYNSANYNTLRFVMKNYFPTLTSSYWLVNGCSGSSGIFYFGCASGSGEVYYGNGSNVNTGKTAAAGTENVWDYDAKNGTYKLNGETLASGISFTAPSGALPLSLFGYHTTDTSVDKHAERIYDCQIYDNGTFIRDYYPATVDGEIGLWDACTGVLYTDAAGGTFIAGPYLAVDTPANFEQILAVYLRWGEVECEAYKIYRNGSLIGTTTDTFYVDITAEQNTEYTYTLVAYRGATESEPTELTVYTRSGYFVLKPLIESAFFQ